MAPQGGVRLVQATVQQLPPPSTPQIPDTQASFSEQPPPLATLAVQLPALQ